MSDHTTTTTIGPGVAGRASAARGRPFGARPARVGALFVAALFALHGAAHAAGVAGIFGLGDAAAENTSSLLPGLDPGSSAFQALGMLWVVALGLFIAAATGLVLKKSWWLGAAVAATLLSLALCVVWFDAAIVGLVLNGVILLGLLGYALPRRRAARSPA
jgi:hypothetical protein